VCVEYLVEMLVNYHYLDEVFGGAKQKSVKTERIQLVLVSDTLTAREIISEKARAHYRAVQADMPQVAETRLDLTDKIKNPFYYRYESEEESVGAALDGFKRNKYFFFWNDEQVTSLDQRLQVLGENYAKFIGLIPLKGG
jgi:hypothetical protein